MKRPTYTLNRDLSEGELEFKKGTLCQPIEDWNLTGDLLDKLKEERSKSYSQDKMKMVLIGRTWLVLKENWIREER